MSDEPASLSRIETKANYTLDLRRKAWEIVLNHLKQTGLGHGGYLKLVKNSIASALRTGTEVLDYKGQALNYEALQKDDLFGFLGGTRNPTLGPHRKISDAKFAVLDAYFCLIKEPLWTSFTESKFNIENSLAQFWRPGSQFPESFLEQNRKKIWITSSSILRHTINNAKDPGKFSKKRISAVRLFSEQSSAVFGIAFARFPLVSNFLQSDEAATGALEALNGDLQENEFGIQVYVGAGCLVRRGAGSYRIISVMRDDVTYQPTTLDLSVFTSAGGKFGSDTGSGAHPTFTEDFTFPKIMENGAELDGVNFPLEEEYITHQELMFNDFFFERLSQVMFSMGPSASI